MKRDWLLENLLCMTLLMVSLPTLIAYRALIQPEYEWGWFGVSGKGRSAELFWLVLPLVAWGWTTFILGARRPGGLFALLLVAWNAMWFGVSVYGSVTLGDKMTMHGDAWGIVIPMNIVAPVVAGVLTVLSIVWWRLRRKSSLAAVRSPRIERFLMVVSLVLGLAVIVLFLQGDGSRHSDFDRAAVVAFVAHALTLAVAINPWSNRIASKA